MSRNQLKSDDVDGFVLAFWDEISDIEKLYSVKVMLDLRLKINRAGICFHAHATREDAEGAVWPVGHARQDFPSDKCLSLHAALYRLAMQLNRQVQDDYRDRTGQWYSTPLDLAGKDA